MSHSSPYDMRVQEFLSALTDAYLSDKRKPDLWELAVRYDIPAAEAQSLATMVNQLDVAFENVMPASSFKQQLRQELIGDAEAVGMFGRVRNLPPRLQVAAGVALVAALALLGRKRVAAQLRQMLPQLRDTSSEGKSPVEFLNS